MTSSSTPLHLQRSRKHRHLAIPFMVAALVLAACGGDDSSADDTSAPTTAAATATTAAATDSTTTGATAEGVAAGAATTEAADTTKAPAKVEGFKLRIGVVSSARSVGGPLGWGDEKGVLLDHLAAVGVEDVELLIFGTGPPLVAALENGDVDVVSTGDVPSIAAASEGLDSRLIQFGSVGSDTWLIGQPDGPKDVAGLVGKTVTAPPGTSPERFVVGLIDKAGLSDQIKITNLATPDAITALRGGQVDAIPVGGVQAARLQDEGYTVIAKARDTPELTGTSTIVARQGFLDEHPGFATAFGGAWTDIVSQITGDFDGYLEWLAGIEDEPVELIAAATTDDLYPSEQFPAEGIESLKETVAFLQDRGIVEGPFDVDEWIYRD